MRANAFEKGCMFWYNLQFVRSVWMARRKWPLEHPVYRGSCELFTRFHNPNATFITRGSHAESSVLYFVSVFSIRPRRWMNFLSDDGLLRTAVGRIVRQKNRYFASISMVRTWNMKIQHCVVPLANIESNSNEASTSRDIAGTRNFPPFIGRCDNDISGSNKNPIRSNPNFYTFAISCK